MAFHQAWQDVIQRHTALRTGFLWKNRALPVQFVLKEASLDVIYQDWRAYSAEEQQMRQQAYLQDLVIRGLPLGKPPLMHLALFHLADQSYRFLWASHHIILDGWSTPLIFDEVLAFYQARLTDVKYILPPAPPYRRYIDWLNRQASRMSAAQVFWQEYLQGFYHPTPLGMPVENAKGVADSANTKNAERYNDIVGVLFAEATAILQDFAQKQQVTLSTLIQCAWALLLYRYSGQTDVLFGATVSGRPSQIPNVESIIGLFINTLPIRYEVAPTTMFPEWLTQQQRFTTSEYAYCSAGQIHAWSELSGALPLFHSLLVFQNYPTPSTNSEITSTSSVRSSDEEGVLEVVPVDNHGARTPYPLTMLISPMNELGFHIVHDRDYLSDGDATQILAHWQTLLQTIASNPHQTIQQLIERIPTAQIPKISVSSPLARTRPYVRPRTLTEQQLVQIWEETVGVHPIGVEDNFFESGGHSLIAVQLLANVQQAFGQGLPLRTLFEYPTIAAMAKALQQIDEADVSTTQTSSVVALQPRGTQPPFYCLPGAGGGVLYFHPLAQAMGNDQPFYALESVGLDGKTPPFTTVEAAATYQVEQLCRHQPSGPYYLGGHSFGGFVAFEMAQQLLNRGANVGAVVILDTPAPNGESQGMEEVEIILLYERLFLEEYGLEPTLSEEQLTPLAAEERLSVFKKSLEDAGIFPPNTPLDQIRGIVNVVSADGQAGIYLPTEFSRLPIHLFIAEEEPEEDNQAKIDGWSKYGDVTALYVPGTHNTMMHEAHVDVLAQKLADCLQVAQSGETGPSSLALGGERG